jgi:hypothetical protein
LHNVVLGLHATKSTPRPTSETLEIRKKQSS